MTTLLDLKPAQITPHGKNPRTSIGDVSELADSIRSLGILEPLIVAPVAGKSDKYLLIAGHRRLAAAKAAKTGTVPALVREDLDTEAKQLEAMLVENLHRADLTPIEEGDAYVDLLSLAGYTQAKLAKAIGRTTATIRERVKIAKLPDSARKKVHAGQLSLADAVELGKYSDDHETFAQLLRAVGTSNFRYYVQRAKEDQLAKRKAASLAASLRERGITVYEDDAPAGCTSLTEITSVPLYQRDPYDKAVAEHETCPGHAMVVEPNGYPRPDVAICTKPDLHPAATVEDERQRRNAEAAAERERVDTNLATAAAARKQWLWEQLQPSTAARPVEDLAVDILRAQLEDRVTGAAELFAGAMGMHDDTSAARTKHLRSQLKDMPLPQLVILNDLADRGNDERGLRNDYGWPQGDSRYYSGKAWIQTLTDVYGYPWTDVEKAMLQPADEPQPDIEDVPGPDDLPAAHGPSPAD